MKNSLLDMPFTYERHIQEDNFTSSAHRPKTTGECNPIDGIS